MSSPRKWPGWDGWGLIALTVAVLGVYLGRGVLGGGQVVLAMVVVNSAWLGISWWRRRQ